MKNNHPLNKTSFINFQQFSRLFKKIIRDPAAIVLILIFFGALFFRFYNIPARYGFDYDAARDALVSFAGAAHLKFPLIGPPSAQGSFAFGPWYYYILIVATILSPFGYAPWIIMGIFSILCVWIMYVIGCFLEDKILGLILAGLSAFATSQIVIGTGLSNPDVIPLLSEISLLLFVLCIKKKLPAYISILWGFCLGVGLVSHFQMIGLFILPCIAYIYKRNNFIINTSAFIGGFAISIIPTFIFDIQHNWYTTKGIAYYILHGADHPQYFPNSWKIYLFNFWPGFLSTTLGIHTPLALSIFVGFFLVICYAIFTKKLSISIKLLFVAFIIIAITFRYYSGERAIYYTYFLQPFIFIFSGYCLWFIEKLKYGKFLRLAVLFVVLLIMIIHDNATLRSTDTYISYNTYAEKLLSFTQNKPIELYNCGNYLRSRAYAVAYILSLKKKLSQNGMKIGLFDSGCNEPAYRSMQILLSQKDMRQSKVVAPLGELSFLANSEKSNIFKATGWQLVSPEQIYDNITATLHNK